ncbi:galactose-1-phosphate uridylyltransferase [Halarcobacter ebronensis]|uniref:galactose-1-phosphate uridylyltransferase n=1 Tax=Halarcobacter ebronensis TaxID=1462615 RepID=UPI0013E986AC|nr:galactose-1-phosphate uridylyltransferase [Halarcobacter ebronensis]QKF83238.1 galactose-1-phosphate uridylyltransferase [Halarcobacter ebronensis]
MSEFRYCKLRREWTLFAPERLKRPKYLNNKKEAYLGEIIHEKCPFDMGREEFTPNEITRISQDGKWKCRVVPNLYNALSIETQPVSKRDGYFEKFNGFGAHEVVIETPNHDKQIWDYDYNDLANYFTIIQERVVNLKRDSRFAFISIFKNQGEEAGASISHSHSQIMALPFLPKKIKEEIEYKKSYYSEHKRALLDDLVYEEQGYGKNIISQNSEFIIYCPYASIFPFEVKIVAKKKLSSLSEFSKSDISALCDITKEFFNKYYKALGEVAFNMIINNAPYEEYSEKTKEYYRFNIEIEPRIYKIAGFEINSLMNVNVMLPETAAKIYKDN